MNLEIPGDQASGDNADDNAHHSHGRGFNQEQLGQPSRSSSNGHKDAELSRPLEDTHKKGI